VPTLNTDWWNYGGLTRDVSLIDVPAKYIDDYDLHLNHDRTAIEGSVHVEDGAPGDEVTVSLPELNRSVTARLGPDNRGAFSLSAAGLELWAPEHPKLYKVRLQTADDRLDDLMGFRTIEVRGTDILLNGNPVFLRGISIHAEAPIRGGRANSDQDAATLLGWAKELDCNYVRLAHYPHDQRMTRAADRLGLMVWSEIPVYWAEHFGDPAVLAKAEQQLREEIVTKRRSCFGPLPMRPRSLQSGQLSSRPSPGTCAHLTPPDWLQQRSWSVPKATISMLTILSVRSSM